ncbi:DUF4198 domain-containing protein [Niveispirillum sp. KHB5.9]|uniref:DUF4198 domain-containing protein n=1 Tax=Niveispirillum sp. KHB5.9 TaxID=3400269 RepID=UPI003A8BF18F
MAGNGGALSFGILLLIGMLATRTANAHDFWIQPQSFHTLPGQDLPANLMVGDHETRQRSPIREKRILVLNSIGPAGIRDQRPHLSLGAVDADMHLSLDGAGTHLIVLETNHVPITLPPDRFNAYIRDEGLTPAIAWRAANNESDRPGRELYGRRAKSIIQQGAGTSDITRPVGLSLEIVPETHPGLLTAGQPLPVRILFNGVPLPGAQLVLTDLRPGGDAVARQVTDTAGHTSLTIPHDGPWLLSTVWTKPLADRAIADFETTFSSLSFAIGTAP